MRPQAYQTPEIRDENDSIIQQGTFGKKTPFVNSQNDGILDYIINNLEAIKGEKESKEGAQTEYKKLQDSIDKCTSAISALEEKMNALLNK